MLDLMDKVALVTGRAVVSAVPLLKFSQREAPQGIRVNLACPGFIDTPMHHRVRGVFGDEIYDKNLLPRVHTRRAGRPEEIAQTIFFLCSDASSYISGTTVTPDGGFTLTI
jgi:NAD(P)-dependent dehydrogenase (short-subunit alcohol dehydrogenase family)